MAKKTVKTTTEQVSEEKSNNLAVESEPEIDVAQIVESQNEINDEDIENVVISDDAASGEEPAADLANDQIEKKPNFFTDLGGKIKGLFTKKKNWLEDVEGVEIYPSTYSLSTGEKVKRFFKSQSGWLFVLPAVILMCVFTFYPIVNAFIGAFKQNYNGLNGSFDGWGFENFVRVLKGDTGTGGANFLQ